MHPKLNKYDPLRSPSWRCERVLKLRSGKDRPYRPNRFDDDIVRRYWSFLGEYERAQRRAEQEIIGRDALREDSWTIGGFLGRNARLWYADRLHRDASEEVRALVQAAILARETDEQIAARCGTLPGAIYFYELLFFDVRDRLDCINWIVQQVLEPTLSRRGATDDVEADRKRHYAYKYFAYFGGADVLNRLLGMPGDTSTQVLPADVDAWLTSRFQSTVRDKALETLLSLQTDKYNVMDLLQLGSRTIFNDKRQRDANPLSDLEVAVAQLIQDVPWEMAERSKGKLSPLEERFATSAVEPRADEQGMIAAGITPPGLSTDE